MKSKKRSAMDFISYLPYDIIENILQRLIFRDAVRTSILSREWRYKWASLPGLDLKYSSQLDLSYHKYLNTAINQILKLQRGPVQKFEVDYMNLQSSQCLRQWFDLLSNHPLERIFLHWWLGPKDYGRVPSNLFSFSQLSYLYLAKCVLRLPSTFKGFSCLVYLEILNVQIKCHKLSCLISRSPLLEHLVIRNHFNSFKPLHIVASKLKKFQFDGHVSSIHFVNVPLLEEVHIGLVGRPDEMLPDEVKQDNFMKSLAQLPSVTKLVLTGAFLRSVALDGVLWQNLTYNMNHLKILALDISYELVEVSCAVCLIRSAPTLESLHLVISGSDLRKKTTTMQFLKRQRKRGMPFSGLKEVNIWWLHCGEPDMELVKLFFSLSTALEKFVIPPRHEGSYLLEELVRMPKASPNVEITFYDEDAGSDVYLM